jgi:hypothetical protein
MVRCDIRIREAAAHEYKRQDRRLAANAQNGYRNTLFSTEM